MQLSIVQVLILALYAGVATVELSGWDFFLSAPLTAGAFTGLLLGNLPLGIAIGGTMQMMSLGLHTYGGATVPDYLTGTIVGTAFSALDAANRGNIPLEESVAFALTVAIPVGLLLMQADILRRTINVTWVRMMERAAESEQYNRIPVALHLGMMCNGLSRTIPCLIALALGSGMVTLITENMPMWLTNGLRVAGGMLPAMGIAILMNYLPIKKYFAFFIFGLVLFACLKLNMVAIALVGLGCASVFLMLKKPASAAADAGADMEVEIDG